MRLTQSDALLIICNTKNNHDNQLYAQSYGIMNFYLSKIWEYPVYEVGIHFELFRFLTGEPTWEFRPSTWRIWILFMRVPLI